MLTFQIVHVYLIFLIHSSNSKINKIPKKDLKELSLQLNAKKILFNVVKRGYTIQN